MALALRAKYPSLKMIIAADDDHLPEGNPGMSKATVAALEVGGLLAVPSFPAGRPDKSTDFKDLQQLAGVAGSASPQRPVVAPWCSRWPK